MLILLFLLLLFLLLIFILLLIWSVNSTRLSEARKAKRKRKMAPIRHGSKLKLA